MFVSERMKTQMTASSRKCAVFAAALAVGFILVGAKAQNPVGSLGAGTLGSLILPNNGVTKHEGSWDRRGGNADMRGVNPGETITLMDVKGAGIVRRFWVTIAPRATENIHRQAILRMYWDGETKPSVESPIGDFFGVGFGKQVDYQSLPLNQTSGGYNCYWPMPFHKSARWTLTNLSKSRIDAFYYNIDYTAYDKLPADTRLFHAQWRRENPTTPDKNYTILEATGAGHYVGTAMFMQNLRGRGLGFLEGDEMIWVDGEKEPSVIGTGAEDYFSSGWYYDRGTYSANYHGIQIKDTENGRINTYRWHIEDAMPFKKSIKVTIEHGTNNDHKTDYSSVAYWYQTEPHTPFYTMPSDPADLLPYLPPPPTRIPSAVEGESLVDKTKVTTGTVQAQMLEGVFDGSWSGGSQLWWIPDEPNGTLESTVQVPTAGTYEVTAYLTTAPDYGTFRLDVNGQPIGGEMSLYSEEVSESGPIPLGNIRLKAGPNVFKVVNTGKDSRSTGHMFGLDAIVMKPVD